MGKELLVTIESVTTLQGTLTIPTYYAATYPAIIIIGDTGKMDRNGNVGCLQVNVYKELAHYWTALGFAVLRYDKRGVCKSKGNYRKVGIQDLIDDATLWVRFLKDHPLIDPKRIIIAGHGEGALLAPAVYSKESVAGLIMLAGAVEPSNSILETKLENHVDERCSRFVSWLWKVFKIPYHMKLRNDKIIREVQLLTEDSIRTKGIKLDAKWLRERLQYNIVTYLEKVLCPVLAITGGRDIQVPPEHVERIVSHVNGKAEWHIIPNMNHVLRNAEHKHTMPRLRKEYKGLMDKTIEEELLHVMKEWLKKHYLS
ncbi:MULTISPECIES: S9 family peptidase [unclassified Bacillus cereus group]|uniref:alpha/beta hydrolase family protein n=1 Tax=unclassified Bacillus cereus group TaxID=2750818 RepID=UPI001F56528D|nr:MULTISPECIES: alpha/beta hydrolase [unclassified Bacillus cereus group]